MAKTPQAARELLDEVWAPARAKRAAERDALQKLIAEEGGNFALAPWDWRYYAEKLRKARYDLDEAEIKPYFAARQHDRGGVRDGAAGCSGCRFKPVERAALSSRTRAPGR